MTLPDQVPALSAFPLPRIQDTQISTRSIDDNPVVSSVVADCRVCWVTPMFKLISFICTGFQGLRFMDPKGIDDGSVGAAIRSNVLESLASIPIFPSGYVSISKSFKPHE